MIRQQSAHSTQLQNLQVLVPTCMPFAYPEQTSAKNGPKSLSKDRAGGLVELIHLWRLIQADSRIDGPLNIERLTTVLVKFMADGDEAAGCGYSSLLSPLDVK
ncbi:hypothetical protein JHW43_005437 [Diplocarpon mali]|nr:hypothetical protein JHW43_005437 [Diplocarpon mali]